MEGDVHAAMRQGQLLGRWLDNTTGRRMDVVGLSHRCHELAAPPAAQLWHPGRLMAWSNWQAAQRWHGCAACRHLGLPPPAIPWERVSSRHRCRGSFVARTTQPPFPLPVGAAVLRGSWQHGGGVAVAWLCHCARSRALRLCSGQGGQSCPRGFQGGRYVTEVASAAPQVRADAGVAAWGVWHYGCLTGFPSSSSLPAPCELCIRQFILATEVRRRRAETGGWGAQAAWAGVGRQPAPVPVTRVWCHPGGRAVSGVKYELRVPGHSWGSSSCSLAPFPRGAGGTGRQEPVQIPVLAARSHAAPSGASQTLAGRAAPAAVGLKASRTQHRGRCVGNATGGKSPGGAAH